jgi:hypothetical protein
VIRKLVFGALVATGLAATAGPAQAHPPYRYGYGVPSYGYRYWNGPGFGYRSAWSGYGPYYNYAWRVYPQPFYGYGYPGFYGPRAGFSYYRPGFGIAIGY